MPYTVCKLLQPYTQQDGSRKKDEQELQNASTELLASFCTSVYINITIRQATQWWQCERNNKRNVHKCQALPRSTISSSQMETCNSYRAI